MVKPFDMMKFSFGIFLYIIAEGVAFCQDEKTADCFAVCRS